MPVVLVVEDNDMNRDILARRLVRAQFTPLFANDGEEAVAMAAEHLPALILMDMSLPVLDGWNATRRLKAQASTAAIPVIALTAHAMHGDRERALAAGCDDYDTKPVEWTRLRAKMDRLLGTGE